MQALEQRQSIRNNNKNLKRNITFYLLYVMKPHLYVETDENNKYKVLVGI